MHKSQLDVPPRGGTHGPDTDGRARLTVDDAKRLGKHAGDVIRLNDLETIDGATATALARHTGSLELDGLSDLEPDVAASLASHAGGSLSLNGLCSLTADAERALAGYDGNLRLAGIHALTTAAMAGKYRRGEVQLGPIKMLSPDAVAGLVPSPLASACADADATVDDDDDFLDDVERPSEHDLHLPDLQLLTPEVAAALARVVEGRLLLEGLIRLPLDPRAR